MTKRFILLFIFLINGAIYAQKNDLYFQQNDNEISLYVHPTIENKLDTFPDMNSPLYYQGDFKHHFLDKDSYQFLGDTLMIQPSKIPNRIALLKRISWTCRHTASDTLSIFIDGIHPQVSSKDLPNDLLARFKITNKMIQFVILKYDNAIFEFVKKH